MDTIRVELDYNHVRKGRGSKLMDLTLKRIEEMLDANDIDLDDGSKIVVTVESPEGEVQIESERTPEEYEKMVHELLDGFYWLPKMEQFGCYERSQDDHDGDWSQRLAVMVGPDGDMHVATLKKHMGHLRFRTHMGGGGSVRVRNALMILAEAIRLENEERPQRWMADDYEGE